MPRTMNEHRDTLSATWSHPVVTPAGNPSRAWPSVAREVGELHAALVPQPEKALAKAGVFWFPVSRVGIDPVGNVPVRHARPD